MRGANPGCYVRIVLTGVSCELVTNFDPHYPLVVGGEHTSSGTACRSLLAGLLPGEHTLGFVSVRLKKHRW